MEFDFDKIVERRGTDSQKWQKYAGRDILPLWVADMDFPSPPAVLDALHRRTDHGVFGYARPVASTVEAVCEMLDRRHGWKINPGWLVWLPGLVVGLNVTCRAFAGPGTSVMVNTPVYPPFLTAPRNNDTELLPAPLARSSGRWEFDFDAMERAVRPDTRLFILCNPHNPVGRVFRREELERLADFCLRRNIVLCSDEIHCDLILDDLPHTPTAILGAEVAARTVTLLAPSKTYNVPGLGCSLAVIPDPGLRRRFNRAAAGLVAEVTVFGYAACEAAFRDSEPWRLALLDYLRGNRDHAIAFVRENLPGVEIYEPIEATYLAWLNVSALNLDDPVAHFENHGVGLSDGRFFGQPGNGHVRLNYGCPRATLVEALRRMKLALG